MNEKLFFQNFVFNSRIKKRLYDKGSVITTYTIDGLFERSEFGSTLNAQDTVYVQGINNELVMQYTKASTEYLSMLDPQVYGNIFDLRTFEGFTKYAYYCLSDHLFDRKTPHNLVLAALAVLLLFCLYYFGKQAYRGGMCFAAAKALTPLVML